MKYKSVRLNVKPADHARAAKVARRLDSSVAACYRVAMSEWLKIMDKQEKTR